VQESFCNVPRHLIDLYCQVISQPVPEGKARLSVDFIFTKAEDTMNKWKGHPMLNKVNIDCHRCRQGHDEMMTILKADFYKSYLSENKKDPWWPREVVETFGMLCWHDNHAWNKPTLFYIWSEREPRKHMELHNGTKFIVHVAMNEVRNHYAVIKYCVDERSILIYEGKHYDKEVWRKEIHMILQLFGLTGDEEGSSGWTVSAQCIDPIITQLQEDDNNCGPIVCANLILTLAPQRKHVLQCALKVQSGLTITESRDIRRVIVEEMIALLQKYKKYLYCIMSTKWVAKHNKKG
jgi:hypothetical protein